MNAKRTQFNMQDSRTAHASHGYNNQRQQEHEMLQLQMKAKYVDIWWKATSACSAGATFSISVGDDVAVLAYSYLFTCHCCSSSGKWKNKFDVGMLGGKETREREFFFSILVIFESQILVSPPLVVWHLALACPSFTMADPQLIPCEQRQVDHVNCYRAYDRSHCRHRKLRPRQKSQSMIIWRAK